MDLEAADARTLDVRRRVARVSFCYYTDAEALRLSVQQISNPTSFTELGRPLPGGLYDPALGPTSHSGGACPTCGLPYHTCPGHFGHIELPVPLLHPLLLKNLYKLLKASCWHCAQIRVVGRRKRLLVATLRYEHAGLPSCAEACVRYRITGVDAERSKPPPGVSAQEFSETKGLLGQGQEAMVDTFPERIRKVLESVSDKGNSIQVEAALCRDAEEAWQSARKRGRLVDRTGPGWEAAAGELLSAPSTKKCALCGKPTLELARGEHGSFYFGNRKTVTAIIGPIEIAEHLKKLWSNEREALELLYCTRGRGSRRREGSLDSSMFFIRTVLVPPSRFRPAAKLLDSGTSAEHPQNVFFQRLLSNIDALLQAHKTTPDPEQSAESEKNGKSVDVGGQKQRARRRSASAKVGAAQTIATMQQTLVELYDSPGEERNGGAVGIRQQLETKQGLFRMHMMGKRVNFSCRSVIGPDVFLDTSEVGIPESFAKRITVPEAVTASNLASLQQAVLNGPDVYPGANAIEDWNRNGNLQTVRLRSSKQKAQLVAQASLLDKHANTDRSAVDGSKHVQSHRDVGGLNGKDDKRGGGRDVPGFQRTAPDSHDMEIPKRVLRHLRTGDVVLFNRQPTLHRVSMMAHRVRVLPGDRTIRFHYANCKSYNADFDGDEMNIHVPQDELARAEAATLALSDAHYVVPTSGEPIRGLIQDHILAAAVITKRDTLMGRELFSQLLYVASERLTTTTGSSPSLRYEIPEPAILKPTPLWTGKQLITALLSVVRRGRPGIHLASKSRVKADLIGPEECKVIIRHGELLQGVLDKNAFGSSKFGLVHAIHEAYGSTEAGEFLSCFGRLGTYYLRVRGCTTGVDDLLLMSQGEDERRRAVVSKLPSISYESARAVHESLAREDGEEQASEASAYPAHGGVAEASKIVADVVQRKGDVAEARLDAAIASKLNALASEVNRCIPARLIKKFPHNGFSLMTDTGAKGSSVNSSQISCLVGSTMLEGKRMTRMGGSGSTLPCFPPYDSSANAGGFISGRFLTGLAPYEFFFHTLAGRDGLLDTSLKTANSGYLQRCLVKHLEGVRLHYDGTVRDSDGSVLQMLYGDDGLDPCKAGWLSGDLAWIAQNEAILSKTTEYDPRTAKTEKRVRRMRKEAVEGGADPLLEALAPGAMTHAGVVSESFEDRLGDVLASCTPSVRKSLRPYMYWRYRKAGAEAGDAVGVVAAQSVGEPSTQMTLNTFHHAGSESKHVTMGIPRLRELLMTAARYPRTPTMTLPVLPKLGEEGARELSRRFANVSLHDLLENVKVLEGGLRAPADLGGVAIRSYTFVLCLPQESLYSAELGFSLESIQQAVEDSYIPLLTQQLQRELRSRSVDADALIRRSAQQSGGDKDSDSPRAKSQKHDKGGDATEPSEGRAPAEDGGDVPQDALLDGAASSDEDGAESASDADVVDYEDEDEGEDEGEDEDEDEGEDAGREDVRAAPSETKSSTARDTSEPVVGVAAPRDASVTKDSIEEWRKAKRAELDAKRRGKSPKDSVPEAEMKNSASPQSARRPPAGPRATANKRSRTVSTEAHLATPSGGAGDLEIRKEGREIHIPWYLPQQLVGQLRIADVACQVAGRVKLASVDRITKCFIERPGEGDHAGFCVATEGSNLEAALELGDGLVDLDAIETNDMYGILMHYGVEAMRAALISDLQKIFKAYGIPVNVRHLALLADHMTAHGSFRGFNRQGISSVPSMFQKLTFETTLRFLSDAVLDGAPEEVSTAPSSAIAVGELYEGGTGSFDILNSV